MDQYVRTCSQAIAEQPIIIYYALHRHVSIRYIICPMKARRRHV